jgi:ribonuclease HI
MSSKPIRAYTDASVRNSHMKPSGNAGYAANFPADSGFDISGRISGRPGSSQAEAHAVTQAIKQADKIDPSCTRPLHVFTDSANAVSTHKGVAGSNGRLVSVEKTGSHGSAQPGNAKAHASARKASR